MKTITLILTVFILGFSTITTTAHAQAACSSINTKGGGVDVWPWSVAQPFPWDNIQGYWKIQNEENSYIKARILSATNNFKLLAISIYGDGYCSKPYATGRGYIDITEKNVVRAIISDGTYEYQLKLGLFNFADISDNGGSCKKNVMAASMQVIGTSPGDGEDQVVDSDVMEVQNMMLKKVTVNLSKDCKKN
jgi:hypothetical protein